MPFHISRRNAMISGAIASSLGLPRLLAADVKLNADAVRFRPEIEPLVRIIEITPRERIFEAVASEIRRGRSYQELLAALFLAAIRNVQPRPAVGFKFHSVLVVNSAHLASIAARDSDRWLPIFWSIDYFKQAQQQDMNEGDWTMSAVEEDRLPPAHIALDRLRRAMESWDVEAADLAAAAAARVVPAHELFDLFAEFGSRDFRNIGHKAIYVAGAFRVLEIIGFHHAEPVMRGLAYALLNHTGDPNPSQSDLAVDRAGRENIVRAREFRSDWLDARGDANATSEFVEDARRASPQRLSELTAQLVEDRVSVDSIFDGLYASAAELVMRQPAIVPLHAMTTTNAIHYLYRHVHREDTRRWLVLQNAAFIGHFRESAEARGTLADRKITDLEPATNQADLEEVLAGLGADSDDQASRVLGYLAGSSDVHQFMGRARELVFQKGNDAHDYKYSSALLEDYHTRSPAWRDRIMAASSHLLAGSTSKDTGLAERVRAAFA